MWSPPKLFKREQRQGGGLGTILHNPLNLKKVFVGIFDFFEYLATQIKEPKKVLFINIYKPTKLCSETVIIGGLYLQRLKY